MLTQHRFEESKKMDDYDPQLSHEDHIRIRFMPQVIEHITQKANELLESIGSDNFHVVVSANTAHRRPRAYVVPSNKKGVNEELSQAALLKAALGMAGK